MAPSQAGSRRATLPLSGASDDAGTDTPYAWLRLAAAVLLSTVGSVGMWSVVVALPAVQAEFGVARGAASLPYALTMLGFGLGGVLMGRAADRFGVAVPVAAGAGALGLCYAAAGLSGSLGQFALAQGLLIGLGSSATFAPLIADASLWSVRRRGIAVALCASGNYLAGAIWPPLLQHATAAWGWRATHVGVGVLCAAAMLPLSLVLRRRPPAVAGPMPGGVGAPSPAALGLSPGALQGLLAVAGVGCCVAMAMPQVHIVAYCGDYPKPRGNPLTCPEQNVYGAACNAITFRGPSYALYPPDSACAFGTQLTRAGDRL